MKPGEFLAYFSLLENNLFNLKPTFNRRQGLIPLLKELEKEKVLDSKTLKNIHEIYKIRNQVATAQSKIKTINMETAKALLDLLETIKGL